MPQGRKRVPFSGKAKKLQLKAKNEKKRLLPGGRLSNNLLLKQTNESDDEESQDMVQKLNQQPATSRGRGNPNRYVLQFHRESDKEMRERKEQACKSLNPVGEKELEVESENYFLPDLDIPKRPPWNFEMSRDQLEAKEHRYFTEYISSIEKNYNWKDLSYFELNLETWRQLWRVVEISDIILVIVDIRFSSLLFPPSLYHFVTDTLHKEMILVLNKVDLVPAPLVVAWKHYFEEKYPSVNVIIFTSFPGYNLRTNQAYKVGLQERRKRGKMRMAAEGAQKLLDTCKTIVKDQVDLTSWQNKISEEMNIEYDPDDGVEIGETITKPADTDFDHHEKYKDGILTIGCVGQPNVGKSSLMNALMGRKVVSVSKTPGHTKHFQTIFLTANVRLCDCPGLVFPSKVPKTLQILMGSFPIAQLREPFSVVQFLAERMDLPGLLKLQHPEGDDEWSAMDVCNGWALKRSYYTARAARLDSHRAANQLLRMALEGKICLCLQPPGYNATKEMWRLHKDVEFVKWVQARLQEAENTAWKDVELDISEDEEGESAEAAAGGADDSEGSEEESDGSEVEDGTQGNFSNKFSLLADGNE